MAVKAKAGAHVSSSAGFNVPTLRVFFLCVKSIVKWSQKSTTHWEIENIRAFSIDTGWNQEALIS